MVRSRAHRQLGRHYTPPELARRMVRSALDAVGTTAPLDRCRVLDPACGDGAFLIEVFDELCELTRAASGHLVGGEDAGLSPAARLAIASDQVFGVDVDPVGVATLRQRLFDRIGMTGAGAQTAESVVRANIRVGDALIGTGQNGESDLHDFPSAAMQGGFDLVIGNPPYLRERDARELFARIAASDFGRRWREARMDLWHYFVHRGLDQLRPGGMLSFVVNSYWTASRGAGKMIARLERETRFEEIELLGDRPMFAGVAGKHMVFRVRKLFVNGGEWADSGTPPLPPLPEGGREIGPPYASACPLCRIVVSPRLQGGAKGGESERHSAIPAQEYHLPHADLFQHGRLVLSPPDRIHAVRHRTRPLAQLFETRQGMAENPPAITRRLQEEFDGKFTAGEGVFVLTEHEVDRLRLTPRELTLLRPYYDTAAVGRFRLSSSPTHQVLYLTRDNAPALDDFPNVARHLERFRLILERRREARLGKIAWWHLHWPRVESIFRRPRILSVQMGRRPQFVAADRPTFVGFSINVILPREGSALSLPALTGLLNSTLAAEWFERHAKHRGVHLEINAHVLREFPLPEPNAKIERTVAEMALRQPAADPATARSLERQIDEAVEGWYGIEAGKQDCEAIADGSRFPCDPL